MYSIPEDFDISVWLDTTLDQVSYTTNTVNFHFDKGPSLSSSAPLAIATEAKQFFYDEIFPVQSDMGLLVLLGQRVSLVSTDEERKNLSLEFENGYTLELINHPQYESYEIAFEEGHIVV